MLNFRNPFPKTLKVFKYEFLNTYRILLPMYGIILLLGIFSGLTNKPMDFSNTEFQFTLPDGQNINPFNNEQIIPAPDKNKYDEYDNKNSHQIIYSIPEPTYLMNASYELTTPVQYSFSFSSSNNSPFSHLFTGLFGLGFSFFNKIILIITMVLLIRRFKKSMFEDEAYLNLSLPVTAGEHLWGRYLCYMTWILICLITMSITAVFSVIKTLKVDWIKNEILAIKNFIQANGGNYIILFSQLILMTITICSMIILFAFCINSIAHLFKKHKGLVKILATIAIIGILTKAYASFFNINIIQDLKVLTTTIWYSIILNLATSVIFMGISQFIISKHLNLE